MRGSAGFRVDAFEQHIVRDAGGKIESLRAWARLEESKQECPMGG